MHIEKEKGFKMLKKLFFIFVLVALMLSGCESEKIEEATENSTELKEENTTEYRIINRERTLDAEEFLTNKGDVSVTRYVYSTIVDSQTYYDYEYYVWVEGQRSQIPIEKSLSEDTEISIVKLTKEYVIIFVDEEFQLIKYKYKDKEFDLLTPKNDDILAFQYSIEMRDYWWVDSAQAGYYFNIETEEILKIENVIDTTITFPGFYVEDSKRGIDTPNGVILSLVKLSEEQLEIEGQYSYYWTSSIYFNETKDGKFEFKFSDFILYDTEIEKIIGIINIRGEKDPIKTISVVVLTSNNEIRCYDFENGKYIVLGKNVMPRTIVSNMRILNCYTEEYVARLSWVDKDYVGYAINDVKKNPTDIKTYENVLNSNFEVSEGIGFKVKCDDERLNIYPSYKSCFIIKK